MRRTLLAWLLTGTTSPAAARITDSTSTTKVNLYRISDISDDQVRCLIDSVSGLSKHLFQFKFDAVRSFLDRDRKDEDVNEFVSAVCWKANSNVMVAANSQGTIKVLELV